MNSARERILDRVRRALAVPSSHVAPATSPEGGLFPPPAADNLVARFREELAALFGEWVESEAGAAFPDVIRRWLDQNQFSRPLATSSPELVELLDGIGNIQWIEPESASRAGWEDRDVGITLAEALIAESGTIVVSSKLAARAASVLPPVHLVIATPDQLVPDIDTAIARLRERYGDRWPSSLSLITGPSRTADIEKILVLGAHGPRRLAVLLTASNETIRQ